MPWKIEQTLMPEDAAYALLVAFSHGHFLFLFQLHLFFIFHS